MENIVKRLKRISVIIVLIIVITLCLTSMALAVGAITDFRGTATSTTISLTWVKSVSTDNTTIRYSTSGFPVTPTDGTHTYNGTLSYANISGLTPGTSYYISAFAFDGSSYSSATQRLVTTLATISENTTIPYSAPVIPAQAYQAPSIAAWSIHPIDDILDYFTDESYTHGGLGMPTNNFVMFLAGLIVAGLGIYTYIKWRTFFASWTLVLITSFFCVSIGVMQGFVIGLEILIGMGVWAVDKSYQ